ncbi:MAG: T9SS type A sorting domain-containing protein [Bacteroidetes bacterium]|nr:T9SS type A sorting domain-containing protein [Bacteroidota bacterium]
MKKILLVVSLFALVNFSEAQNIIPNPGFETWNVNPNYDDPASWGTINGLTWFLNVRTVTKATAPADIHGGSFAIKLESKAVIGQGTAPGIAATGSINTGGYIDGGLVYNKRPISMTGWYKYTPGGTDTGSIEATLSKWNSGTLTRDVVGRAVFEQNVTVGSYTQFTVNFTYNNNNTPDTLVMILLTSSQGNNSPTGSKLWVDDLDFVLCNGYTATPTTSNATCTLANGSASVATTNGTLSSSYHWSNSSTASSITVAAGTYTITATDFNGCTATASAVVGANTTNIGAYATSTNTLCTSNSGTAEAGTNSGADPNTYMWSTSATTFSISNLAAGTYLVTVTDNDGCTGTASATVSATTTAITSTITSTATTCGANTGTATVTPTNGTANYSYAWNNGGTTDAITGLGAGGYQVTITDANGCSGTATTSVTAPGGPSATQVTTDVTCNGAANGAVDVTTVGGTGNIVYQWNPSASTEDISALPGGNYTLTITDGNNCSFTISATVNEPAQLMLSETHNNVLCNGGNDGSIQVTSTGGTLPYTYNSLPLIGNNLTAGTYAVTVTDNNSCSTTASIMVSEPTQLTSSTITTNASSSLATDGSIAILANGGTPAYTFSWSSGTGANLAPGIYCYTVTDANSCVTSGCDTVSAPSAIGNISTDKITLYPNPANNQIMIETNSANSKFSFSIFNVEGKLMSEQIISGGKISVDVKHLAEGFYSYQLKEIVSGDKKTGKLQIQR